MSGRTGGFGGNLPAQVAGFVGRAREVRQVKKLFGDTRLVTMVGVGGVGKTALALRVARESSHIFPDGAWFAPLGDLPADADAVLLEQTVAAALGLRGFSVERPRDALIEHLRGRCCLLLLDNCEHLVEPAGALVAELLSEVPGLRVLTTSRQVLGCSGEHVVQVTPLAMPEGGIDTGENEAVELLRQRAAAAAPLASIELELAAELCRRLDGLPLAIELAASRLRILSLTEILERLDNRFGLLTDGARHGPATHQSLRRVMDWSYQLCDEAERLLWERVSMFVGGFDRPAAEAVCAGHGITTGQVLDLLSSLVGQSILIEERGGRMRYRLLETLREYGLQRLTQRGVQAEYRQRHHDYYQHLATQAGSDWCGAREVYWLDLARTELPNLRAAMRYALEGPAPTDALKIAIPLAHLRVWFFVGWLGEGRAWLERGAALYADPADPTRLTALAIAGWVSLAQGDVEGGRAHLHECRTHADSSLPVPAVAFLEAAYALLVECDPRSVTMFEHLLRQLQHAGAAPEHTVMIGLFWAMAAGFLGDRDTALSATQDHLDIAARRGASWLISWAQWAVGLAQLRHGDRRRALNMVRASLRQQLEMGDSWGTAWGTYAIAWILAAELDATQSSEPDQSHHRQTTIARTIAHVLGGATRMTEWAGVRIAGLGPFHAATQHAERIARQALGEQAYLQAFAEGSGTESDRTRAYQRILAIALNQPSASQRTLPTPIHTTASAITSASNSIAEALTRREREIAALVANGMTNPEIARKLFLSIRTVQTHVGNILNKRGLRNRQEIAVWYARQRTS